jgi:XTP/dITP diphosphohydrolase
LKELVLATRNKKKLSELKRLFKGSRIRILGLNSFSGLPIIKEDKNTFKGNAVKKAIGISKHIDKLVCSDDSGLEVPALNNRPGVLSARYAGCSQDDDKNIAKLLLNMKNLKGRGRKACFKCIVCVARGNSVIGIASGKVEGRITNEKTGLKGFGYDPVFIPKGFSKTFAQLQPKTKDSISHRAIAIKKAKKIILQYFQKYP